MLIPQRLRKIAGFAVLVTLSGVPALDARTRKGDRLMAQSRAAEVAKDWDKALAFAEEALSEDPADIAYQLATTRLRFYTGQYHVDEGRRLRDQGQLEEALAQFQKAYGINPALAMAQEEIERTRQMIERDKKKAGQKPEERALTPVQAAAAGAEAAQCGAHQFENEQPATQGFVRDGR